MNELDTTTDFIKYLNSKEFLFTAGIMPIFLGNEADLLALYIHHNRIFPIAFGQLVVSDELWSEIVRKPEYIAKKEEDQRVMHGIASLNYFLRIIIEETWNSE